MEVKEISVSVIVPVYMEELHLEGCIRSLLQQRYPREQMEWIFVDGGSSDRTVKILQGYQKKYPRLIRYYDNPGRIQACAMNIGIQNASGNYIIRMDAHAVYPADYIAKCVWYLEHTDADNVGGIVLTRGCSGTGKNIAKMLSSRFGVGNSGFRTFAKGGYVDTVPYGAFRKEVFEKWGGFDERLVRGEDNEINYRIRKNGGKVLLADDIVSTYYCRDTVKSLCSMAFRNGKWNVITSKYVPGAMGIRHFVPLVFLLSLIGLGAGSICSKKVRFLFIGELSTYFVLDTCFSFRAKGKLPDKLQLMCLHFLFHISYGAGSLAGIAGQFQTERRTDGDTLRK